MIQSLQDWFMTTPVGEFFITHNLALIVPEFIILFTIGFTTLMSLSKSAQERKDTWWVALFGLMCSLAILLIYAFSVYPTDWMPLQANQSQLWMDRSVLYGMFNADLFSLVFRILMVFGTILVMLMSRKFVDEHTQSVPGEFYVILLTAVLGAMFLAGATDLVMVFVALETLGIASYVMGGYLRGDMRSAEASLKYLLYGGASTAVLLFGLSLLYGLTKGSTQFSDLARNFQITPEFTMLIPVMVISILASIGFKLSMAPFHMWTPDVYEGAPTPVTAFLSVVSKMAGFALAIRIFMLLFEGLEGWSYLLIALSILSMTVGNVLALVQKNFKRMLAYSTIAHAGYLLMGLIVMTPATLSSVVFYLIAYLFMNLGAFAVAIQLDHLTGREDIASFSGLVRKRPVETLFLSIFLLSLAGIPITGGFFAKFYLFQSVANLGDSYLWIVFVALLNSTISLFYYLNVIRVMVVSEPSDVVKAIPTEDDEAPAPNSPALNYAMMAAFVGTMLLGFLTQPMMDVTSSSVNRLITETHWAAFRFSHLPQSPVQNPQLEAMLTAPKGNLTEGAQPLGLMVKPSQP